MCRDGSRQHDAVCGRNGMQGYGVTGVLLSDKGTKLERRTEIASTLMARDYKGFGNQAMTGVMEIKMEKFDG